MDRHLGDGLYMFFRTSLSLGAGAWSLDVDGAAPVPGFGADDVHSVPSLSSSMLSVLSCSREYRKV